MRFVRAETRANHTRDLGRIVLGRNSVEPITSRISNEVSVSKQDGFGVLKKKVEQKLLLFCRMDCDDGSLESVDDEGSR